MIVRVLTLLIHIVNLVYFILSNLRDARMRQEGRDEVIDEIRSQEDAIRDRAQEIDAGVRDADLDDLEQRMRNYQRP